MKDTLEKVKEKIKKIIRLLIKSPLFRKIVIIAIIIIAIYLLFVIAAYKILDIDTAGEDGSGSVMSKKVSDTLTDEAGIGKRKGVIPESTGDKNNISEDKVFYIGDSWMVGLKNSGKASSPTNYFYAKTGENADWVLNNYSDLKSKIPNDISCIVVEFGLNGLNNWAKTQELIDKLTQDYSEKSIYVLQTPHICDGYTADSNFNSKVDTYNENMKNYCSGKSGVTFINSTTMIVSENGAGYLKDEYALDPNDTSMGGGKIHLNNNGYNVWYTSIIQSINSSTSNGGENSNNRSIPTGDGQGKVISESDYDTTGYSGIYKSGITGREFIEYKQNADTYLSQYPIDGLGCNWHSECGTVTTIIIGSGYSDNATLEDAWNNLKNNGGQTDINGWIQKYASSAQVENTSIDKDNIISLLSQGAVLAVHSPTLTSAGHYFALLDINSDHTQVYVSNPWGGPSGDPAGWSDIDRVQGLLDTAIAVSNDGDLPTHKGGNNNNKGGATYTTTNVVKHITENGRDGYKIDINLDEMVDKIIKSLQDDGEGRLLEYFTDSNRKKYLKSFLKAAIVTQYPDLRKKSEIGTEVPEDELQGVVKVRRRTEDTGEEDNGELLQYIPLDDFNKMKTDGNTDIFNYYTLDSNSNIVVAGYEKRTVEPQSVDYDGDPRKDEVEDNSPDPVDKITYSNINYIQQVEKYAMPFDLLWTLLVYSQDEDFVYKLSELAIKNDIVVTVHDSVTYTDTIDEYVYTKNVKTHEKSTFSDTTQSPAKVGNKTYEGDIENQYNYKITNKNHYESNNPILAVTYVDSWVAKYENKYKKVHQGPNTNKNEIKEADDEEYSDDGTENTGDTGDTGDSLVNRWKSDYKSLLTSAYSGTDKQGKEKYSISTVLSYKKKVTDKKRTVTTTKEKNTYQSQPAEVQGKYDSKSKEDNFVTLLKKSGKSGNLKSVAEWFFESIEKQESICDMLDLMKFLLGKAYNEDYGVKDYDFSIYKPEYFVSVNGNARGALLEMLKSFENDALRVYMNGGQMDYSYVSEYVTEDRKQYKLYYTSFDGCLNFSYGIMVRDADGNLNNEGYFSEEGIDLAQLINQYNSGQEVLVDAEKVDRIKEKIVMDKKEGIREQVESHGVKMEEHQLDALTMVAYQYGNCGEYISGSDNIAELFKTHGNTEQFRDAAVCQNGAGGYSHFFVTGVYPDREEYTWRLFHEGIYTLADGTVITSGPSIGIGGPVVEKAIECHKYLRENGFSYNMEHGKTIPEFFESPAKHVDCSTYVSWVLYMAGYNSFAGWQETSFRSNHHELVEVSSSDIQPGDVLVYSSHVEIAAKVEGGTVTRVYNCGSDYSLQSAGTSDCPESVEAIRWDYVVVLRAPN